MSRKIRITIKVPKLIVKGRVPHLPTKAEKPAKGRGTYDRRRDKRDWQNS